MAESFLIRVTTDSNENEKAHHFNHKVITPERIILITNCVLELPAAVFDQLSSVQKPQYALLSMLISCTVLIISIIDLVYNGRQERVRMTKRGLIPWFYHPDPNSKPFGTFPDIIGLICAIFQSIFASIQYAFLCRHADNPIKVSVWPIVFAFGAFYSRLSAIPTRRRSTPFARKLNRAEKFTLAQLTAATEHFSLQSKVGEGCYCAGYKGKLSDGREAVIKRWNIGVLRKKSEEEESAFAAELTFMSRLHHKHLARLFGYCEDENERIIVYEFLNNGSLDYHLHNKSKIQKNSNMIYSWKMRIKIALEAARGIEYLHNYAVPPVIHRSIKSTNILLDKNWTTRVCGFEFSSTGYESESDQRQKRAAATVGYVDPEYYTRYVLTEKSDVYSFGVILLEILTGKRAIFKEDDDDAATPRSLVDFAVPKILANELAMILDHRVGPPELADEIEAVETVAYTALYCVNLEGNNRPNISNVAANLEQAFSLVNGRSDKVEPKLSPEFSSSQ